MKVIAALLFFALYTSSALAGAQLDLFSKAMASYLAEQNKTPIK